MLFPHFHKKDHMTYELQHTFLELLQWFSSSLMTLVCLSPSDQILQSDYNKTPSFGTDFTTVFLVQHYQCHTTRSKHELSGDRLAQQKRMLHA